jgi:hypothetical protein
MVVSYPLLDVATPTTCTALPPNLPPMEDPGSWKN